MASNAPRYRKGITWRMCFLVDNTDVALLELSSNFYRFGCVFIFLNVVEWVDRKTCHVVTGEDLWLLSSCNSASCDRRCSDVGTDDTLLEHSVWDGG